MRTITRGKTRLELIKKIKDFLADTNLTYGEFCISIDISKTRFQKFMDGKSDIYLDEMDLIKYGMLRSRKKYLIKSDNILEKNLKKYKQWNRQKK